MKNLIIAAATMIWSASAATGATPPEPAPVRNVVLVHGAYADGSGWRGVADILQKDGFRVTVVQEPETSLAADVAATRLVLDRQPGPTVLVGHSYGGAVITEAGEHPKVKSLVYVAAFAPDVGQTLKDLGKGAPRTAGSKDIAPADGFLFVNRERFPYDFAADLAPATARFMALSQVGQSVSSASTPITNAAWRSRPAFGIVATEDRMIGPVLERKMYAHAHMKAVEVKGSHAVYVSQPAAVARIIELAARAGAQ